MANIIVQIPPPQVEQEQQRPRFKVPQFQDPHWERERQLVAQRSLMERLRYKGYVRRHTLSNFIQRLGNWGRNHFPFIGRGWNGIGPR